MQRGPTADMDIVLDFDGTITTEDTISHLAQVALRFHLRKGKDLSAEWTRILQAYDEEYRKHVSEYEPRAESRFSVEDEVRFLRSLHGVESNSIQRVAQSGIFSGLPPGVMREAGVMAREEGHVNLRPGFLSFARQAGSAGHRLSVISVNWSTSFIEGVLSDLTIRVFANEITDDGRIVGPSNVALLGEAGRPIMTSGDKLDALRSILSGDRDTDLDCIYIGDSPTDLECLLHSGGVVLCPDEASNMLRMLRRLSIQVPHVTQSRGQDAGTIFWAQNFSDILGSRILQDLAGRPC